MLRRTFVHLPGIGPQTEGLLWRQGCDSWATYLEDPQRFPIGGADRTAVRAGLEESQAALAEGRHQAFAKPLGSKDAWRAWPEFREHCLYLDIETDGGMGGDAVTCVGLYDGTEFRCLVKGQDLAELPDLLSHASMIVTFYGTGFDLPVLSRCFPSLHFDQIHLDLCFALKRVGVRGGLKRIEKQLGIARGEDTDGLSGLDAIRLWREYQSGNEASLRTLVEYNREDVVNLERLAQLTYDKLRAKTLDEAGVTEFADMTPRLL